MIERGDFGFGEPTIGIQPPRPWPDPSGSEPSGRLQVFEPKDFPYLNTGKSLVFVIARNGMVWGKRLDNQSSKGDVELEVFWPREDGCLVRIMHDPRLGPIPVDVLTEAKMKRTFSREQGRKIESMLSQKEIIRYELGTLMVRPFVNANPNYKNWRHLPQYQRMKTECQLSFSMGEPCNIRVIHCPHSPNEHQSFPNLSSWNFYYDDAAIDFKFFTNSRHEGQNIRTVGTPENPVEFKDIQNIESSFYNGVVTVVNRFFATRLCEGRFDMSGIKLRSNIKVKPSLRMMYGEYDFFEYFDVDDAVLLLEEETISADFPRLFWTLGIAQNKHVREMMRLASNNPGLFEPLFQQDEYRKLMWGRKKE